MNYFDLCPIWSIFVPMNSHLEDKVNWSKNIILVDGDYADRVAFDLIVNFERMLNRRIPAADLSQWLVNIALDGRLKPGNNEVQVVLLHDKKTDKLANFNPSSYESELNKQAFKDEQLGEFILNDIPTDDDMAQKKEVLFDLLYTISHDEGVNRIMLVADTDDSDLLNEVNKVLKDVDDEQKHITVFAMQPLPGGNYRQEILGYSLMNAMGIRGDEFK